ncbi:hypothetical protein ND22_005492 [Escherichia coli]|nr:hypothetical protein [Escherichia coli]
MKSRNGNLGYGVVRQWGCDGEMRHSGGLAGNQNFSSRRITRHLFSVMQICL